MSITFGVDMTDYPCRHEAITHKVSRVIHNVFHPHHKVSAPLFAPPMMCHAPEPEMETVTVTADVPHDLVKLPPDAGTPGFPTGSGGSYYSYAQVPPMGIATVGHNHPVAVPEPGAFALLAVAIAVVFWRTLCR